VTESALGLVKRRHRDRLNILQTAKASAQAESFQVPALIADIGLEATKRYFEFFSVPIRNKNTRIAYYHTIGQLLDWCRYIEQHAGSPATIKQHMSAIRMLFSWLTEKGI
jgi:integrase/recombinase XerD